jgi:hypothetical protein
MGLFETAATLFEDARNVVADLTGVRVVSVRIPYADEEEQEVTLDVPGYRQVDAFGCGFVAGLMVLHTFKPRASIDRFYKRVAPTGRWGASAPKIVRALRHSGIAARARQTLGFEQVCSEIDAGHPVITLLKTRKADTEHWVVVYGYGLRPKRLFVAGNGYVLNRPIAWADFRRRSATPGYGLVCSG